jgi:hypothetical protein
LTILSDFLLRNAVKPANSLPLLHSTRAYHLRAIKTDNKLIATKCAFFKPDKLNYFFVGRPAYKYSSDDSEAERWELPCCFIFDFATVKNVKRIFPFDSGAYKKKLYPSFINGMPIEHFEASAAPDAAQRIIGAFFGDTKSYFHLNAKDKKPFMAEFSPGAFDAELEALHRLSIEKSPATFDDRRFTIEVQTTNDLDLTVDKPLAVVAPAPYFDDADFLNHVENVWKAQPIPYSMYRLSVREFYSDIYRLVDLFLQGRVSFEHLHIKRF